MRIKRWVNRSCMHFFMAINGEEVLLLYGEYIFVYAVGMLLKVFCIMIGDRIPDEVVLCGNADSFL